MPKWRPTENSAFSGDAEKAGRELCELVLGVAYTPQAARFYAAAIKRRDADKVSSQKWRAIAIWGLAYVDGLVEVILD